MNYSENKQHQTIIEILRLHIFLVSSFIHPSSLTGTGEKWPVPEKHPVVVGGLETPSNEQKWSRRIGA